MARKGVAILREISMVKASDASADIKERMLKELNAELLVLYGAFDSSTQGELVLERGASAVAVDKPQRKP